MAITGPYSFKGGLNTRENIFNLPDGQCSTFTGARVLGGRVFPLNTNTTTLGTFSVSSNSMSAYFWTDPNNIRTTTNASISIVIAAAKFQTAPWAADDAAQTFTDRTNAQSIPNSSQPATFSSLNGILVTTFLDTASGFAPLQLTAYNGNVTALSGTPPKAGICLTVNNFMFLSANYTGASTLSRIYWSNVGDPQTWGAGNFIDVGFNDGDFITGLSSIGTDLYIFKTNSIWRLSTTTITTSGSVTLGPLTQVSRSYGVSGQQSIDTLPDGTIVFLSSANHLMKFDGNSFLDLSDQSYPGPSIQPSLNLFVNIPYFVLTLQSGGCIVKVYKTKNEIWVWGKSTAGVYDDLLYIYNYSENYWSTSTSFVNINSAFTAGITRPGITAGFSDRLCILDSSGNLKVVDTAQSTNTSQETIQANISYAPSKEMGVPRSLLFFIETSGSPTMQVNIGFDGSSTNQPYNGTPNQGTLVVPINYKVPQSSGIRPASLNIKVVVSLTHSTDTLYIPSYYLSDEVAA